MSQKVTIQRIISMWWPLAASWMLMGAELPLVSAVVARLPDPRINLAAYSGIVFPLILIIESPIIMLLGASTALSKDWVSYKLIYRFMMTTSAALTVLHALVAFTPLYYLVADGLMGASPDIVPAGRIGLMIMLPWTWTIAYRRFHQGVLIRFGHSRAVGLGSVVRLLTDSAVLLIGFSLRLDGIVVATLAIAAGVTSEAIYAGIVMRPLRRPQGELRQAATVEPALTLRSFLDFYIPLVLTSFIWLLSPPITSAALNRMPQAIDSLAVWGPLTGLVFMLRSLGTAYNEVVVALLDDPGSWPVLRRFTNILIAAGTGIMLLFVLTPLSGFWFGNISALGDDLTNLAVKGLWLALPLPALTALQSWYQGGIMFGRHTRGITEAVVLYLITSVTMLSLGVLWGEMVGLFVGLWTMLLSGAIQTFWLGLRAQSIMKQLVLRDAVSSIA